MAHIRLSLGREVIPLNPSYSPSVIVQMPGQDLRDRIEASPEKHVRVESPCDPAH